MCKALLIAISSWLHGFLNIHPVSKAHSKTLTHVDQRARAPFPPIRGQYSVTCEEYRLLIGAAERFLSGDWLTSGVSVDVSVDS